jgi:DNA-directed RNA polymerase subunit RPC12/RpoP
MKCPRCGKELEKVIVITTEVCEERSEYKRVGENIFEFTDVVDRDSYDEETEGVECSECGARLNVKRFFDSKVELDGDTNE